MICRHLIEISDTLQKRYEHEVISTISVIYTFIWLGMNSTFIGKIPMSWTNFKSELLNILTTENFDQPTVEFDKILFCSRKYLSSRLQHGRNLKENNRTQMPESATRTASMMIFCLRTWSSPLMQTLRLIGRFGLSKIVRCRKRMRQLEVLKFFYCSCLE